MPRSCALKRLTIDSASGRERVTLKYSGRVSMGVEPSWSFARAWSA